LLSQRSSLLPLRILRQARVSAAAGVVANSEAVRLQSNAAEHQEHRAMRGVAEVDAAAAARAEFRL
jgi:hypothetical protein